MPRAGVLLKGGNYLCAEGISPEQVANEASYVAHVAVRSPDRAAYRSSGA
jgi:hypothetical protein